MSFSCPGLFVHFPVVLDFTPVLYCIVLHFRLLVEHYCCQKATELRNSIIQTWYKMRKMSSES